jgi:hypothetical protein
MDEPDGDHGPSIAKNYVRPNDGVKFPLSTNDKNWTMTNIAKISGGGSIGGGGKTGGTELRRHLGDVVRRERLCEASDFYKTESCAVCFDRRIYLVRDHQTALVHWAKALREGRIGYESHLFHLDAHPDTAYPNAQVDRSIFGADGFPISRDKVFQEAVRATEINDSYPDLLPEESFIRLGIDLKIVGSYLHVVPGSGGEFLAEDLGVPSRTLTLDATLAAAAVPPGPSAIFDLDLDFFSDIPNAPYDRPANRTTDLEKMLTLLDRLKPGVITIAFSPMATNFLQRYMTLDLEKILDVVTRVIERAGVDWRQESIVDEPRRRTRYSPK